MTITGSEWLVILAGIAAIGWVNWYFFVAGRAADASQREDRRGPTS